MKVFVHRQSFAFQKTLVRISDCEILTCSFGGGEAGTSTSILTSTVPGARSAKSAILALFAKFHGFEVPPKIILKSAKSAILALLRKFSDFEVPYGTFSKNSNF